MFSFSANSLCASLGCEFSCRSSLEVHFTWLPLPRYLITSPTQQRCVDKMPTGRNANRTKCQPRLAFCPWLFSVVGILSGPTFWLAFCPDHLKMSWHPLPNVREWGGPVTSFCLLLTVVGKKVDNFLLLSWSGENFAIFDHHHLPWITLPSPHALAFCC